MAGLHLVIGAAFAAPIDAPSIHLAYHELKHNGPHRKLTLEGPTTAGPCSLDVAPDASDREVADALVAGCQAVGLFLVVEENGYTHVYPSDAAHRLLDREVTPTPGTRSLRDFASELTTLLEGANTVDGDLPFSTVAYRNVQPVMLEVPAGKRSVRDLLRELRGLPPERPWWDPESVDYEARALWTLRETDQVRGLNLRIVDFTAYPGESGHHPRDPVDIAADHEAALRELESEAWEEHDQIRLDLIDGAEKKIEELQEATDQASEDPE